MTTVSHTRVHTEGAAAGHAPGATGAGSVVLELGGDIGVLVLHAPARLHRTEIEISPESDGPHGRRTHSLVRERITASGTSHAAVYPGVPAGRYTIWGMTAFPWERPSSQGGRWPVSAGRSRQGSSSQGEPSPAVHRPSDGAARYSDQRPAARAD